MAGETAEGVGTGALVSLATLQYVFGMVATFGVGVWLGANYAGVRVAETVETPAWQPAPAWVGDVEWLAWMGVALVALAVVGWIATDYQRRRGGRDDV